MKASGKNKAVDEQCSRTGDANVSCEFGEYRWPDSLWFPLEPVKFVPSVIVETAAYLQV